MTAGGSPSKDWEWVLTSLWNASGIPGNRCVLNLPDSILFVNGEPRKWLATAPNGCLERRTFGTRKTPAPMTHPPPDPIAAKKSLKRKLAAVREGFVAFQKSWTSATEPIAEEFICVARYKGRPEERLTLSNLDTLLRHPEWREQVTSLQAYVPVKIEQQGQFPPPPPNAPLGASNGLGSEAPVSNSDAAALNGVTSMLAHYTSSAHVTAGRDAREAAAAAKKKKGGGKGKSSKSQLGDRAKASAVAPTDVPQLRVVQLRARFGVDFKDALWLLGVGDVQAQLTDSQEAEAAARVRSEVEEEQAQVDEAQDELLNLVNSAMSRGLGAMDAFAHFDVLGLGVVDAQDMLRGLKQLGIPTGHRIAALLVQRVAMAGTGAGAGARGSSGEALAGRGFGMLGLEGVQFTLTQLERFVEQTRPRQAQGGGGDGVSVAPPTNAPLDLVMEEGGGEHDLHDPLAAYRTELQEQEEGGGGGGVSSWRQLYY